MLNMLQDFSLETLPLGSAALIHLMTEVERRAYADRAEHLGDPDFWQVPQQALIARQYAAARMAGFDPERASSSMDVGHGLADPESEQTTHFSVIDDAGMMVALTTTLNSSFGSQWVVPGTGILLNNEMDDFAASSDSANQYGLVGNAANAIEPRKRMLSSMSPTIVLKSGQPYLITGSPGGSTIITTVLQVIVNMIDFGLDLEAAVRRPRIHHQWQPDVIYFGPEAIDPPTQNALRALGHQLKERPAMGDANSISIEDDVFTGFADPREGGAALGY
jgi:gamma-glutamyltranspeptidase/glutathione hydrolase